MSRLKGVLWSLVAAAVLTAPAFAQIGGRPVTITVGAGGFLPDARERIQDGPAYTASLGLRLTPTLTAEATGLWAPSETDTTGNQTVNFSHYGLDLVWALMPGQNRAIPYLVAGFGYGRSHSGAPVDPAIMEHGTPSIGAGLLLNVLNQRTYVRLQAKDYLYRARNRDGRTNDIALTAGLTYVAGGKVGDQDLDGVRDWLDKCPNTPIGAKVDGNGCPTDADRDSVFDGLDKCPDTPFGAKVDKTGCPLDADGDGVPDGLDRCADTPKGAKVDSQGCPLDSDGDGVFDGLDQCDGTPGGARVDANGCPLDADGDGVADGIDQCEGTPAGFEVDATGCIAELAQFRKELMETGKITAYNINFDTGKSTLKPESFPILDLVGGLINGRPDLKIEIGGHTDNSGTLAANRRLSEARAKAVRAYFGQKFPEIGLDRITAKGYGPSQPVGPNDTPENKLRNRRVEFKVLNMDALQNPAPQD